MDRPRVSPLAVAAWLCPAALVALVYATSGSVGFNPTDEGFIAAQSYRLLHGAVPHAGIISARPLGSALLHTVDFLIPLPLLAAGRLLALVEIAGYTLAFARVTFERPLSRWSGWHVAGAGIAFLVNVHTFPLMAWHTIDGLLVSAIGLALVVDGRERGRRARVDAGMLLLGFSLLVKQSFVVPWLLGLWLTRDRRIRSLAIGLGAAATYVTVVAAAGGFGAMVEQIGASTAGFSATTLRVLADPSEKSIALAWIASVATLILVAETVDDRGRPELTRVAPFLLRAGITVMMLGIPIHGQYSMGRAWSFASFGVALVVAAYRSITGRRIDVAGAAVVSAGLAATASWGYAVPALASGSASLYVVARVWQDARSMPAFRVRAAAGAATLCALAITAVTAVDARRTIVYRDAIASHQPVALRSISPEFGSLTTNRNTGAYMRAVASCIRRYAAARVAVVPNHAVIYPALGLSGALPAVWLYPSEIAGSRARLLAAAHEAEVRGNYLFLFDTLDAKMLVAYPGIPDEPGTIVDPFARAIESSLTRGRRISCGPFVGRWQPPP